MPANPLSSMHWPATINWQEYPESPEKPEIIYFDLDGKALVADLPGYGYSAASKAITAKFSDLCDNYFRCGRKISLVLFLMDIRRTPSEEDIGMLNFLNDSGIPYIIVFTKCDKLSNAEIKSSSVIYPSSLISLMIQWSSPFLQKTRKVYLTLKPPFQTSSVSTESHRGKISLRFKDDGIRF